MARETMTEKRAQLQEEHNQLRMAQAAQYLPKLMTALEEATRKNNYELTVTEGMFRVRDRDAESWVTVRLLSPTYTQSNWDDLESLEWDLEQKAAARAEAERKILAKQAALAKLTAEEREALGL